MITAKMMMLGAALAGAAGAGGLGASALRVHGGFGGHDPEMVHRFVRFAVNEKLDAIQATPEQRRKVGEVAERLIKQAQALRQGREDLHGEVLALLAEDEPDAARVRALVQGRLKDFERFADDATDALLELHGTLTPEQRAKLIEAARAPHGH